MRSADSPRTHDRYDSQGAKFLKVDLAQSSSQKRFDFRNSQNYPSTTFPGTSYSQIVVAIFPEEPFCTPTGVKTTGTFGCKNIWNSIIDVK